MSLLNDKVNGRVINLASGSPVRISEVVQLVQNTIKKGRAIFGNISYRTGENMSLYADISEAKMELEWSPRISLEEGVKKTIEYYQNNTKDLNI